MEVEERQWRRKRQDSREGSLGRMGSRKRNIGTIIYASQVGNVFKSFPNNKFADAIKLYTFAYLFSENF